MAKIVDITNPLTGQPAKVDQLDHTAQEIDDAIARALPGGAIDTALGDKPEWDGGNLQSVSILTWAENRGINAVNTHVSTNNTVTDMPYAAFWAVDFKSYPTGGWIELVATDVQAGTTWLNIKNWQQPWSGWDQIATATPPQEYDLPLAAGLSNDDQYARSVYWRDQFGVVTFVFQVIRSGTSADIGNGEKLAVLPAGFRPKGLANFAAHFEDTGNFISALGVVYQDGSIVAYNGSGSSGRKVFGFGAFVAE